MRYINLRLTYLLTYLLTYFLVLMKTLYRLIQVTDNYQYWQNFPCTCHHCWTNLHPACLLFCILQSCSRSMQYTNMCHCRLIGRQCGYCAAICSWLRYKKSEDRSVVSGCCPATHITAAAQQGEVLLHVLFTCQYNNVLTSNQQHRGAEGWVTEQTLLMYLRQPISRIWCCSFMWKASCISE